MKALLRRTGLLIAAIFLAGGVASPGSGVPAAVHYIGHAKVSSVMAKGGPIVSDPGLIVLAQRRYLIVCRDGTLRATEPLRAWEWSVGERCRSRPPYWLRWRRSPSATAV